MPTEEQIAELETRIAANIRRTGINFILAWPIVIALVWATGHYAISWLRIGSSIGLLMLFGAVCIPNIGNIAALKKISGDVDRALRRNLVLADVGALLTLYAGAALWWDLPLPTIAVSVAYIIALINSLSLASLNGA